VLTESRSFRHAYATAKRDSTTPPSQLDWITGDSLTAQFAQELDSITKQPRTRMHLMNARGSARALTHHSDPKDTTGAGPAINYSRGDRITVVLAGDRIDHVEVAGKADGVHLEPRPPIVADSAKQARPIPPPPPPIP
jgi:hypothetical protein